MSQKTPICVNLLPIAVATNQPPIINPRKLTQIGVFWDIWLQSTFFLTLAGMALFMAVVLFILIKPLKKAMPGV